MTIQGEGHIFKRFDNEMNQLHGLVLEMGEFAQKQLLDAKQTLETGDSIMARKVIENDNKLNALDVQADNTIISLIARRQPVAKDLREIIAVGKIVADLERAGDEARKIAGMTIRFFEIADHPPSKEILEDIHTLSEFVVKMLNTSMKSFDKLDLSIATGVWNDSLKLESLLQSVIRRLSTFIMEDSRNIGHFVDIVLGVRALERFGGHAKNIAGHIVFIKSGEDVRHQELDDILPHILSEEPGSSTDS